MAGPWRLRLTPALADLARLYPWLAEAAQAAGVPASLRPGLHVVLEEVVSNAARHGFAGVPNGTIEACLRVAAGEAVLEVSDDGAAFDPTAQPDCARRNLLDDAPGGWGLGLIRHYCQDVTYRRADGRNILTLRFSL